MVFWLVSVLVCADEIGYLSSTFTLRVRAGTGVVPACGSPGGGRRHARLLACGTPIVAIDGSCLDVADTPENADHFGRPASSRGEQSAFPQARLVALAECGTHALFDAAVGPCTVSERELANDLLDRLEAGMLLLADRGFYGFQAWTRAAATGADLLWRVKSTLSPRHLETLEDGSWLARIIPTSGTQRQHRTPLTVRVIDYTLDDRRDNPEQYRLLTTILDPAEAHAQDLALAYAQRWEIENTFDELKTHQRGPRKFCGRSPRRWCSRKSGDTCAATTQSAP